jgi:hypothetical protein
MAERDSYDRFQPRSRGMFGENEDRRDDQVTKSDLVDLDLYLHNDNPTKKAIAVSLDPHTPFAKWVWLPRSLIEYERTGASTVRVTLPERTATEKGLI